MLRCSQSDRENNMTLLNKSLSLGAIAIAASLAGAPLAAQSVSASYPETIAAAIQDMGYRAEIGTDSYGDPHITSASNGVNFYIYFYGCSDSGDNCQDIQFTAAFDLDEGISTYSTNSWNIEKAFGRAYTDDEDDPVFQHYVVGVDGMSRYSFERTFERWIEGLDDYTDFIDW